MSAITTNVTPRSYIAQPLNLQPTLILPATAPAPQYQPQPAPAQLLANIPGATDTYSPPVEAAPEPVANAAATPTLGAGGTGIISDDHLFNELEQLITKTSKKSFKWLPKSLSATQTKFNALALNAVQSPGVDYEQGLAPLNAILEQRLGFFQRNALRVGKGRAQALQDQKMTTSHVYALEMWSKAALKASHSPRGDTGAKLASLTETRDLVDGYVTGVLKNDRMVHHRALTKLQTKLSDRIATLEAGPDIDTFGAPLGDGLVATGDKAVGYGDGKAIAPATEQQQQGKAVLPSKASAADGKSAAANASEITPPAPGTAEQDVAQPGASLRPSRYGRSQAPSRERIGQIRPADAPATPIGAPAGPTPVEETPAPNNTVLPDAPPAF